MLHVYTHEEAKPTRKLLSAPAEAQERAEDTQRPEFHSTQAQPVRRSTALQCLRANIRYAEMSFNPKNAHAAQSGLWKKVKPNKKKSHTLNLCFSSFKRLIPTRGTQVSANSPSVLTCLYGLHLQKEGGKPNTLESWIYLVRFYPISPVKLMKKHH